MGGYYDLHQKYNQAIDTMETMDKRTEITETANKRRDIIETTDKSILTEYIGPYIKALNKDRLKIIASIDITKMNREFQYLHIMKENHSWYRYYKNEPTSK